MKEIFYKIKGAKEKLMLSAAAIPSIEEVKTNLTEKISNLTVQEFEKLSTNTTEKLLTNFDAKYHLNETLGTLKDYNLSEIIALGKKFEGIANNFSDPSGLFNMNKIIGDAMPQIKSYVSQELGNSLREYAPYLISIALGFAVLIGGASYVGSYFGTSRALKRQKKIEAKIEEKKWERMAKGRRRDPLNPF